MSERPTGRWVRCPACNALAMALVPGGSRLVDDAVSADGKVQASCRACGERFTAHYRTDE